MTRPLSTPRRHWLRLAATAVAGAALAGCASLGGDRSLPPIVFVHGNGDSAALWQTQIWRFESAGWPRDRLHAVNFPYPQARDDNTKAQPGRSSAEDQRAYLAQEVAKVIAATGAPQVVLLANSRGGNAVRSCVALPAADGGCGGRVSHAILGGTPNHGVWANAGFRPNNEFNGAGPFLQGLNAPKGPNGDEVTPGLKWMTLRSDNNDKFAQPDGLWIGMKGTPTGVTFDGPALKGAENVVLPARDHREVSYHAEAFAQVVRFVTGRLPAASAIVPEARVAISGLVTGFEAGAPSNQPLAGAQLQVWAVDPDNGERRGAPLLDRTIGADGRWGPVSVPPGAPLEFTLSAPGFATAHIYRGGFPRSSSIVHLRPERLADADKAAGAVVTLSRPRAYFALPRDLVLLDTQPAPGIPPGTAGVATSKRSFAEASMRTVTGQFRSGSVDERLVGRTWPAADGHLTVLELTD